MFRKIDEPVVPWKNQLTHFLFVCPKTGQVGIEKRGLQEGYIVSLRFPVSAYFFQNDYFFTFFEGNVFSLSIISNPAFRYVMIPQISGFPSNPIVSI